MVVKQCTAPLATVSVIISIRSSRGATVLSGEVVVVDCGVYLGKKQKEINHRTRAIYYTPLMGFATHTVKQWTSLPVALHRHCTARRCIPDLILYCVLARMEICSCSAT